jgi:hypothetical protein
MDVAGAGWAAAALAVGIAGGVGAIAVGKLGARRSPGRAAGAHA